ncbi:hypothetical protein AEGHOMDF_5931 [Methylobacterium soli]|nr:hypothetical protein AEGHOMDF_5931 [Methylobacterium soli]
MLTGTSATLKSWAIGPIWAAAIRPPAATITNMAYITQKTGVRTASRGERSNWAWGRRRVLRCTGDVAEGLRRKKDSRITTPPWISPKVRKAVW